MTVPEQCIPTTPHAQPLPSITHTWFSLIHFRSPLLTESHLFSSPTGTEMFHFPASTPTQTMNSPAGNTTQPVPGFPIRTSSDQRLVGNSPRLNAASHVLHRLSMPRHPPYALDQKTQHKKHTRIKMLASTIQFSHTTPTHPTTTTTKQQQQACKPQNNTHVPSQTPNSAPTQHLLAGKRPHTTRTKHNNHTSCRHASTRILNNTVAAPHTGTQPPHLQPQAHKTKAP